jgi:DNA-binding Lrp family transcriptional regulator
MVSRRRSRKSKENGKSLHTRVNNGGYDNDNIKGGGLGNSITDSRNNNAAGDYNDSPGTFEDKDTGKTRIAGLDTGKNPSLHGRTKVADQTKTMDGQQRAIDELDIQLLNLLLRGYDNKQIADKVDNPLSTIQRRTRLIFERGLAASKIEPDYAKLGYKTGYLIIRLKGGKMIDIVERLQKKNEFISISANIGVFPLICKIIYRDTKELWDIISNVQELGNVREVLWSEEIYSITTNYNITSFRSAVRG